MLDYQRVYVDMVCIQITADKLVDGQVCLRNRHRPPRHRDIFLPASSASLRL